MLLSQNAQSDEKVILSRCTISGYVNPGALSLPCFPDFRGKVGYTSQPPGRRPSSSVLYPGPPSSSPRPPTPPFSCLSRCNRAISYVVFLSFPSPGEHMPSLVVDPLSFVLHVLPTSSDSSTIFPSNTSVCQPPLSARPSSSGPLSSLQQSASPSCFHTPAVYVGVSRSQVMSQGHTTFPGSHTRPAPLLSISFKCACQTWLLLPGSMHLLRIAPFFSPLFPIVRRCSLPSDF